jgi:prolyl-tRNA synthetase
MFEVTSPQCQGFLVINKGNWIGVIIPLSRKYVDEFGADVVSHHNPLHKQRKTGWQLDYGPF